MYFSILWGWWNGDLRVFRRDEGHSRSDDGFCGISRYRLTPKGVYTSSDAPFRGGAYPLVVKENSHDLAITYVTFNPTPFWAFGPVSISPAGEVKKHVGR